MSFKHTTWFILLFFLCVNSLFSQSSSKNKICMDIAHHQRFWKDPAGMNGQPQNQIERMKYMTSQFLKTASSVNGDLVYLKDEINSEYLTDCNLLYIHIPSAHYSTSEIKAISEYLNHGGSLFLVMDEDSWSTLKDANVNDIIMPYGIQFGGQSPDSATGGNTTTGLITAKSLKIPYQGGRMINGGTPFCFNNQTVTYPFGVFKKLKAGGKIIVMGDGMVSLYMTSWKGVNDYQCAEFMHEVFQWLLQ